MKSRSFLSLLGFLVLGLSLVGFVNAWLLAGRIPVDFFDSHNFLLQARRLTDPAFSFVGFDYSRPRALVAVLAAFDKGAQIFTGVASTWKANHYFITFLSWLSLVLWFGLLSKLWNKCVALGVVTLLLATELFHHYSFVILSDIFSGSVWALTVYAYLKVFEKGTPSKGSIIALGVLGGFLALTKNHHLAIFPLLVFFHSLLAGSKPPHLKWLIFSYLLTVDLSTRIFGYWGEGIPEHLRHLFKQTLHQVNEPVPHTLYMEGFLQMYGPALLILGGVLFTVGLWRQKPRLESFPSIRTSFVLVNAFYALLNQFITHREMRYMLPFLPGLFAPVLSVIFQELESLETRKRWIWSLALLVALVHPVQRVLNDQKVYWNDPIYSSKILRFDEVWAHVSNCEKIYACEFPLKSQTPFEFENDPYYRQYDFRPQYWYFTGKLVTVGPCELPKEFEAGSCYIHANPAEFPENLMTVFRKNANGEIEKKSFFSVETPA